MFSTMLSMPTRKGKEREHASTIRIAGKAHPTEGILEVSQLPQIRPDLQDHLLQLRELQYHMRYGDHVQTIPTRLRDQASQTKTENWQLLSGPS